MVIDLDLKYVRSLSTSSEQNYDTILTTTSSNRYLNAFSVESISDGSDKLWLKTYDFNSLYYSKVTPILTQNYSFDLGTEIEGPVVGGTMGPSMAICFVDDEYDLNLAFWDAGATDSLYQAYTDGTTSYFQPLAPISVEVEKQINGRVIIQALI